MTDLALGAKRYDGGSGLGVFTGTVPLLPGMLLETQLDRVALFDGATLVGVTASLLTPASPLHPDGSLRVIQVDATLDVNSGILRPLRLVLGQPATLAGPPATTITGAWLKAPRLLGCTDALHLCESRIAPFPLVPVTHPSLPDQWKKMLTVEFDGTDPNFPAYGNMRPEVMADVPTRFGDSATYDALACLYYRYLISGDLDKLADAHHLAQYTGGPWVPTPSAGSPPTGHFPSGFTTSVWDNTYWQGVVRYAAAYKEHAALENFPINIEYPQGVRTQALGTTEWNSGFHHDMWLCFCLSGWPQAAGTLITYGIQAFTGTFGPGTQTFGFPTASYDSDGYGGRFTWRLRREAELFYAQLGLPMDLRYDYYFNVTLPSIRTNRQKYLDFFKAKHWESYETWSRRFAPTDYKYGIWGFAPSFSAGGANTGCYPAFDAIMIFASMMNLHLNLLPDERFVPQMIKYAYLMLNQVRGPMTAWRSGRQLYRMPYMIFDGKSAAPNFVDNAGAVQPASVASTFYTPTMLLALWTWAYEATGDPKFLAVADAHATHEAFVYDSNLGSAGASWKQLGELYWMAAPAAAWRAGKRDGIPNGVGTLPPPPPPDPVPTPDPTPPPPAPVPTPITVTLTAPAAVVGGKGATVTLTAAVSAQVL